MYKKWANKNSNDSTNVATRCNIFYNNSDWAQYYFRVKIKD